MILPNFIIVGAAKSGTTSVCKYLAEHNDIFVSDPKEPHFFITEKPYGPTTRTLEEYTALFSGAQGRHAIGEGSVGYLYSYEEASKNIKAFIPDCRILILLRNPVARAYSMYWHCVRDNREPLTFEQALAAEETRIRNRWEISYHYTRLGFTSAAIKMYQAQFGKKHTKVVFFDDMVMDMQAFMDDIFEFLAVRSIPTSNARQYNKSGIPSLRLVNWIRTTGVWPRYPFRIIPRRYRHAIETKVVESSLRPPPKMAAETQRKLVDLYRAEIHALEELTGRDLRAWLS